MVFFLNGVQALTHGYTFHFAAHEVKSIPGMCVPRRLLCACVVLLFFLYACCWYVFCLILTISLLIFPFTASNVNVNQVGELGESISPSGWNLTFVARGLLKTSITVVFWNAVFNNELALDLKIYLKLKQACQLRVEVEFGFRVSLFIYMMFHCSALSVDWRIFLSLQGGSDSVMPDVSRGQFCFICVLVVFAPPAWQYLWK